MVWQRKILFQIIIFSLLFGIADATVDMRFVVGGDLHYGQSDTDYVSNVNNWTGWVNNESNISGLNHVFIIGDIGDNSATITDYTTLRDSYLNSLLSPYKVTQGNHDINSSFWNITWGYEPNTYFIDGDYIFIILNQTSSSDLNISNTSFLQTTLDDNPSKTAFIFIHVSQIGVSIYSVINTTFQNIVSTHSNIAGIFNSHDHGMDYCVKFGTALNCWDGHIGGNWGTAYKGYRVVESTDNGIITTYQYNPLTSSIINENIIYKNTLIPNGTSYTGQNGGGFRLNYRNDSQLNISGLIAAWNLDEVNRTIIHNVNTENGSTNNTYQGTWVGNATLNYSAGRIGNALAFDGVDDYVNVGTSLYDMGIRRNATISLWAKQNNSGTAAVLFSDYKDATGGLSLKMNTNEVVFYVYPNNHRITNNYAIQPNIWYNLVGVLNDTNMMLYINGQYITSTALGEDIGNGSSLKIGTRGDLGALTNHNGSIDEVRIYNRALSADEIAILDNTSLRSSAMPVIMNQTASSGKKINRVRVSYTGQNDLNNISIYANKSNVSSRVLIANNVTSNTWYLIPTLLQNNSMDFALLMSGNGSNTPFLSSLEWDEGIDTTVNPFVAVGAGALGIAGAIALYNMYRRRGKPIMMWVV